tara:strand:+ start:441 stop:1619 length:1179 start_codon:yes stop_codon:yes gene_type:complete
MGLLSSRTFRQIATGALEGIEDKRQEMRDRIDTYRERAVNKKNEIQKKYNEYFDEEKANIDTFKQVASLVGDDYVGKLNSFVGTDPNRLSLLLQQDADVVRTELDKYKDTTDTSFVEERQKKLKLKEEELTQNLQDQVNLFKGTSSIFTRDIEQRGLKDIQTETGTIDTKTIDPNFQAGPGMDVKSKLSMMEKNKVISDFQKVYADEDGEFEMKDENTYENPLVQDVFTKVKILQDNVKLVLDVEMDDQTALAEVLYKDSIPSYQGDNLKYLTQVGPKDPSLDLAEFEEAMKSGNIEEMTRIAEQNKSLNIHIYNKQMEDIAVVKEGLESGDTTVPPKEDTTPTTDNVGKRPDDPVDARRWNNKYGGKYDPETGDRLPEKEKKVPPRMEQNR